MDDNKTTVRIDLDRYNELIRKEALLDELTKDKCVSVYLYSNVTEGLKNGVD